MFFTALLSSADDFFQNYNFQKKKLADLICVQTVCKGNQQMTLAGRVKPESSKIVLRKIPWPLSRCLFCGFMSQSTAMLMSRPSIKFPRKYVNGRGSN